MRPQDRKLRAKPSVAFASEASARENIQTKLQSLLELLKVHKDYSPADRSTLLKALPSSHRGFNGWASDQLDALAQERVGSFRSNSRIALHRSGLLERVEIALASVIAERNAVTSSSKRDESIAGLARKLKVEIQLRKIAEEEIVHLKRHIKDLADMRDDLRLQLNAANREASQLSASMQGAGKLAKGAVIKLSSVAKIQKGRSK